MDGSTEKRISECQTNKNPEGGAFTLSELLEDIGFNVNDYTCSCNVPVCKNLYLKINAMSQDKETITYHIPIELDNNCNFAG